jgi:hypothetical protein
MLQAAAALSHGSVSTEMLDAGLARFCAAAESQAENISPRIVASVLCTLANVKHVPCAESWPRLADLAAASLPRLNSVRLVSYILWFYALLAESPADVDATQPGLLGDLAKVSYGTSFLSPPGSRPAMHFSSVRESLRGFEFMMIQRASFFNGLINIFNRPIFQIRD